MTTELSPFTPGPWEVGYKAFDVIARGGQMKVCDIRGWGYLTGKGGGLGLDSKEAVSVQVANARLIAAAPDMFIALEALRPHFEYLASKPQLPSAQGLLELIDETLRKARGEA